MPNLCSIFEMSVQEPRENRFSEGDRKNKTYRKWRHGHRLSFKTSSNYPWRAGSCEVDHQHEIYTRYRHFERKPESDRKGKQVSRDYLGKGRVLITVGNNM